MTLPLTFCCPGKTDKVEKHCEITFSPYSNILRNLATIEADVSSHAEAVSQGRLSANATAKEPEKEPQHLSVSGEETEETVKKGWQMVEDWKKRLRKAIR